MDGYATAMRRYFQISGRSGGYEFWMFTLFYLIFGAIAAAIDVRLLGHPLTEGTGVQAEQWERRRIRINRIRRVELLEERRRKIDRRR